MLDGYIADAGATKAAVDLEWICDNVWVVGSPETVIDKLNKLYEFTGGWGVLQVETHDYMDDPAPWFQSLRLLAQEVTPKIQLPFSSVGNR